MKKKLQPKRTLTLEEWTASEEHDPDVGMLDLVLPNGKRLGDCTRSDILEMAALYKRRAKEDLRRAKEIRRQQAAGIAAARQAGKYRGRKIGTTKAKPERAVELRNKGLSVQEIAASLGVSRNTVFRYLRDATQQSQAGPQGGE